MEGRRSRRKYTDETISMAELSFLLWATQGVRRVFKDGTTIRTVPSGGSIHPFDTYLAINHVKDVPSGLYRYQPIDHAIVFLRQIENQEQIIAEETIGPSPFAVVFIWAAVPYRTEWRYVTESAKLILLDAGHVCQNLYLACESIGCGTCAIGAYDQDKFDRLLRLDGKNELVVYLAPVGRV
ncbi:MAG: SagB/ThcOx family dehydrogenase [Candidatus Edwardsbacteria bacterium]|nr:SagB/ThcOx family dehydrogenase [Candidatus Edwardsbacteria bacterium]